MTDARRELWAPAADLQAEPAGPACAARLTDLGVRDRHAAVGGGVEQHLFAQAALALLLLAAGETALLGPDDEVVADALELCGRHDARAIAAARSRPGGQVRLEPRDLLAQREA